MFIVLHGKRLIIALVSLAVAAGGAFGIYRRCSASIPHVQTVMIGPEQPGTEDSDERFTEENKSAQEKEFIKWVDFKVTAQAMKDALKYDIEAHQQGKTQDWIELLAYLGTKYGGDFARYKENDLKKLSEQLGDGTTMEALTKDMKDYSYYYEAYQAVLAEFAGEYRIEKPMEVSSEKGAKPSSSPQTSADFVGPMPLDTQGESSQSASSKRWVDAYGQKAFSPIAKGYEYNDFDDFGTSRDYGYKRRHLGHDLMAQVGTPVIAVESGTVEAVGWNQYGGWRIGIRSFDRKRYYYYAHLRKNMPYNACITQGAVVKAGDVIGYVGRTGYSSTENVNNITQPHLHFGIQLIFDESQKDGNGEIWIDCYEIVKFLLRNQSETVKDPATKEYSRIYDFTEPSLRGYEGYMRTDN